MKPYIWKAFWFTVVTHWALLCFFVLPFTFEIPRQQRREIFFSTTLWVVVVSGLVIGMFWYWFFWFSQGRYEP